MNEHEFSRRQILRLSLALGATMALDVPSFASPFGGPTSHAALEELPPGAVRPQGWLRGLLEKQAAELGSQLPKVSWPFTEAYWQDDSLRGFWWPWEQVAYWIDGATRLALVLDDKALMAEVRRRIDATLAHIEGDGYVGPTAFKAPKEDCHRWPHAIFFRALSALSDAKGADAIPEAIAAHFLLDAADYGKPTRNVTNVESMLWCYGRTGDRRLLALAEKAWKEYLAVAGDPEKGDLSKSRVEANAPIDAHGVTYIETAKLPAILYAHTGKRVYLEVALAAQRRVFDHHMLVDGVPSTSEWYRGTSALDAHETCDISDHTWAWGYLLMATGEGVWGDRIERAVFNAGLGAIRKDWKGVQYFSSPNQVVATQDSSHVSLTHPEYGVDFMAYAPNPGGHTACCGGNVHRFLPNYAIRMWMRSADGGLAATLYGPSKLSTRVAGEPITIVQTTDYPFEERIRFGISLDRPVTFSLRLRVPEWCDSPRVEIDGKAVVLAAEDGFVALRREFKNGETVTLDLPMRIRSSAWPDDGVALEHGPLVYALPVRERWAPVVEPRYSTPEFPKWNATPESAWNYGALGEAKFERRTMTEDPWSHPPVALRVPARRVEGWTLHQGRFTPPLPARREFGVAETITLVPYGSTHLRMTVFPN